MAEGLDGGAHARHVAVVVRAPHVDDQVEVATELVAVIRDVGQQVGVLAVALDEHPVLVVAEHGGAQPDRPLALLDHVALAQVVERVGDGTGREQ